MPVIKLNDTAANKISLLHCFLFAASLPLDRFYSQLILISFLLHTLFHLTKEDLKNIPWQEVFKLQSVFFLTLIGTSYSLFPSQAFSLWEKQLAVLLFPLILYINPIPVKKYLQHILLSFATVNVLVIIFLYYDAARTILYLGLPATDIFSSNFISHKFSGPIEMHATYLSLYCALSLVVVLSLLTKRSIFRITTPVIMAATLILFGGLLQLGSRSVLLATFFILLIIIPNAYKNKKNRAIYLVAAGIATILLGYIIYSTESFNYRFITQVKHDFNLETAPFSIADPRMDRWKLAFELIQRSPWIGYGTGEEVPLLKDLYFKNKMYDSYVHELNAHNQYLSFAIKGGVFALTIYLFTLFYFLRLSIRSGNLAFTCFIILIGVTGLTENLLNMNKGIFFYAFFISLFTVAETRRNANKKPAKLGAGNPAAPTHVITNESTMQTFPIVH
ncbi:MAG: O-antigen ligase family protein [Flavisolibacter sp.]|jgi:hypothetical protein|nr:O-antigen ligase family protein [Flavisolibacter sp.]